MELNKKELIQLLETISTYMELKGENTFKISAFRKAAAALEADGRGLSEINNFTEIPGIGKGTAAVIEEFIHTGESIVLKELKEEVPKGLIPLLQLPGLGGKKIAKLYSMLGIKNIEDLKKACHANKIQELAGFGKKTEEKLLQVIENVGTRPERLPIAFMLRIADLIEVELEKMSGLERYSRAGSLRRMRETIKDLDFIISTNDPIHVREQLLRLPKIKETIAAGDTKISLTLEFDFDVSVDFRLVKPEQFTTTLHHFTGSKEHNVRMRQLAKERGEKISEYGVENVETGEVLTFSSENDFYNHFDLPFIPPEIREDGQEVEEFTKNNKLVLIEDIKGDLHMHSTWSDGAFSIEEMADACRAKGYQYIAITDHSQYLKIANGLDPERLKKQHAEIKRLNKKYNDFVILTGVEMDILPDGTLDYDDELLVEIDVVIASIHSSFSQPKEKIMNRLKNALLNAHVDIIAHPTGRKIGKREGYPIDMDMLIELARETDTALELNANPNRLDLSAENVRKAEASGVKIVINTDAHYIDSLSHMEIGVATARKGWIRKENVINTFNKQQLLEFLHSRNNLK